MYKFNKTFTSEKPLNSILFEQIGNILTWSLARHKFLENNYINLTPSSKYDFFMSIVTNALINSNPKPRINGKKKLSNTQLRGGMNYVTKSKKVVKTPISNGKIVSAYPI